MKKNVPWHILAPSAVACDMFLLRASAYILKMKKYRKIACLTDQKSSAPLAT